MNFGHNAGKRLFANQEGRKHEVIKTLCVIKAMVSWNCERVSRTCRERCGGASYLANTKLPGVLYGSHSGMTAEGDNSVLMQKVVKDIMVHYRKGKHIVPVVSKDQQK